jgi:hypothetical protein
LHQALHNDSARAACQLRQFVEGFVNRYVGTTRGSVSGLLVQPYQDGSFGNRVTEWRALCLRIVLVDRWAG